MAVDHCVCVVVWLGFDRQPDGQDRLKSGELLWRGGLPPLGCEAPPSTRCLEHRVSRFATASQPNGGKPPRHSVQR
ncbi:hypothetical protein FQ192_24635 [Pseudomonas sp. ANT_J12]|nr:hypothetical protein FQ192_24635 [Pseudomonas sp. ANT_J12]